MQNLRLIAGTQILLKKVYRPDIYAKAAKELIAEGKLKASEFPDFVNEDGYKSPQKHFIDNIVYNGKKPNDYLKKFDIGLKGKDMIGK